MQQNKLLNQLKQPDSSEQKVYLSSSNVTSYNAAM